MKKCCLLLLVGILLSHSLVGQDEASKHRPITTNANVQLTNNGLSLFPNLSLGKPATIININMAKGAFAFEPELRWALTGKPWSYIFWLRYRYKKENFTLRLGAHPSYIFSVQQIQIMGQPVNRTITTRYGAAEISPSYQFNKTFGLSLHYLAAKALDDYGVSHSHFISIQPRITNIPLSKTLKVNFYPQIFHLILGANAGTYTSIYSSLHYKGHPLYLSGVVTNALSSNIAGDAFVWSLSVNYRLD